MFRIIPDYSTDRDKERNLRFIATQGVVQLFGAFEKHHRSLKMKLAETRSELQREKVLEKVGKNEFLEILWNEGKKGNRPDDKISDIKDEIKEEEVAEEPVTLKCGKNSKWNVLAEQFYENPKIKDWDKDGSEND